MSNAVALIGAEQCKMNENWYEWGAIQYTQEGEYHSPLPIWFLEIYLTRKKNAVDCVFKGKTEFSRLLPKTDADCIVEFQR